jgi:hypothetical protein
MIHGPKRKDHEPNTLMRSLSAAAVMVAAQTTNAHTAARSLRLSIQIDRGSTPPAAAKEDTMDDSIYIQIIGKHPHAGEYGRIKVVDDRVTVETLPGSDRKMALVNLEDCPHGTRACYIFPGQMRVVKEHTDAD